MKILIDNNILFSLMKPNSTNSTLFSIMKFDFYAPLFIMNEFTKHSEECFKKSELGRDSFELRKKEIIFVKFKDYEEFFKEALKICPDKDDAPYFALALKLNCPIWSNDSLLKKQDKINVLSTEEIIELVF